MAEDVAREETVSSWICSRAAGSRSLAIGVDHGEISQALAGKGFETTGMGREPFAAEFSRNPPT